MGLSSLGKIATSGGDVRMSSSTFFPSHLLKHLTLVGAYLLTCACRESRRGESKIKLIITNRRARHRGKKQTKDVGSRDLRERERDNKKKKKEGPKREGEKETSVSFVRDGEMRKKERSAKEGSLSLLLRDGPLIDALLRLGGRDGVLPGLLVVLRLLGNSGKVLRTEQERRAYGQDIGPVVEGEKEEKRT